MSHSGSRKYSILLLGYLLIFGTYFGIRTVQFFSGERADGEVTVIRWGKFSVGVPPNGRGGGGDYHGDYQCPEIHFFYKLSAADTGRWYVVTPEARSLKQYHPGDKTGVIFPKGQPEKAEIYSSAEFWFTTPNMIIIFVIAAFWSIGFVVVVFKPWRMMDQ